MLNSSALCGQDGRPKKEFLLPSSLGLEGCHGKTQRCTARRRTWTFDSCLFSHLFTNIFQEIRSLLTRLQSLSCRRREAITGIIIYHFPNQNVLYADIILQAALSNVDRYST